MNAWFGAARVAASKHPVECACSNVLNGGRPLLCGPSKSFLYKVSEHYA